MLLALNVGNSNIKVGVYAGERLVTHWRLRTDSERTPDEYAIILKALVSGSGREDIQIRSVGICSVVPPLTLVLAALAREHFLTEPVIVGPGVALSIRLGYADPSELGPDRIANAEAAYVRYGGPVIAVDLGTATTVDAITSDGVFLGGAIAPGIGISNQALFQRAARLSRVALCRPAAAIGRNTADCLRAGIVFGFAGQVDALVTRVAAELGGSPKVVATGGLADTISLDSTTIDTVDPLLTLDGLRIIYDRNR